MTRARYLVVAFALQFCTGIVQAQVQTGTPPFASFGGGPDIIDLANLNSHLAIPILHKAGRGTNFTYDLTYDTSVWFPASSGSTTSWQPISTTTAPGWQGLAPAGQSYIVYSMTYTSSMCYQGGPVPYAEWTFPSFVYYDASGSTHYFSTANLEYFQSPGGNNCPPNGPQPASTQPVYAGDGSGLTLYPTPGAGSAYAYLVDRNGSVINVPTGASPPTSSGSTTTTDRNGNQITSSNGSYTDTLNTNVLNVVGTAPSNTNFSYKAPSGATASFVVKYSSYSVQTKFNCSGIAEYGPTSNNLVSEIDLPDSSKYSFTYEGTPGFSGKVTGRLASVTLPTGGTISYSYTGGSNGITCADGSAATLTRTTPDGTWTYAQVKGSGAASTTTVTDPQGNQTVIQFQGIYETQRQVYQGSTSGTLLLTTNTCYNGSASPCNGTAVGSVAQRSVISTLPNNLQSKHFDSFNASGVPTETDDYDYGPGAPGALLRKTTITYASLGNITAFPQTVTVYNGAGTQVSQTNYNYDETAVTATSGTPQHVAVSGSRGNLTSIHYPAGGLTAHSAYYDTGTVNTATDVNGAVTTNSYAGSSCGNSFPTSVSEPLNLSRSMTWNCTGGVQLTATDENNQTATTAYNIDPYFWRPDAVVDQLGNQTNSNYQPNPTYCCPAMVAWGLIFNNGNSVADDIQYKDGLGRTYVDQRQQYPNSPSLDSVSYTFDANGRPYSVSMPCSVGYAGTCSTPKTTQTYDALNRPLVTTDGGGGTVSYSYTGNDVFVTIGPAPSGENTKRRQLEYDALGRLTSVCEITSASGSGACGQNVAQNGFLTRYSYDALNNLTGVTQGSSQTRSYSFDPMGRLTSEANPESGTTSYTYDSDSTCGTYAGDLVKRVNAAGVATCTHYDALHRPTFVSYSTGGDCKFFFYDASDGLGYTEGNVKGRLAGAWLGNCSTGNATTSNLGFNYSPRGELINIYQWSSNSGGWYNSTASYWANGALQSLQLFTCTAGCTNNVNQNAATPLINYNVDGEGRPYQVSASSGQNPVTNTAFNPASLPTAVTYGSGDTDSFGFDLNTNRMTQYQFTVNSSSLTGALGWNVNGTLQTQNTDDAFNSADTQNCAYQYDDLTRLGNASCGGNQLLNPGFESGNVDWNLSGPWSIVNNPANARSGSWYLSGSSSTQTAAEATVNGTNWIPVTPGEVISFGGWVKRLGGTGVLDWGCEIVDASYNLAAYCGGGGGPGDGSGGTSWTLYSASVTVPANGAYVQFYAEIHGWGDQDTSLTSGYFDSAFLDGVPIAAQTFSFDAFGNISKSGSPYSFQPTYSSASNRMTNIADFTPTYDANGNVTNDNLHTYTWNADGRPLTIDSVNLTYDALGRMVEQNPSGGYTQIIYAPTGQKFALMNGQTLQKAFVPLPSGSLAVYNSSGLLYYGHSDHLGSMRFASTPSRTMYFDLAHAPFGEVYASSGSTDPAFTGQRQDTVGGLYDFPAREYSIQGRWPSPDPAGLAAVDPSNPQSWNRYAYVKNNPLSLVDPSGMADCLPEEVCFHDPGIDFGNFWDNRSHVGIGGGGGTFDLIQRAFTPTGSVENPACPNGDCAPGVPTTIPVYGNIGLLSLIGGGIGNTNPKTPSWCPPGDACDPTSNPPISPAAQACVNNANQQVQNQLQTFSGYAGSKLIGRAALGAFSGALASFGRFYKTGNPWVVATGAAVGASIGAGSNILSDVLTIQKIQNSFMNKFVGCMQNASVPKPPE